MRFVGSATSGADHLDLPWLQQHGIAWATAPGCNADAVVAHVLASVQILAARQGRDWRRWRFGILGLGQVGARLAAALERLDIDWIGRDPLRENVDSAPLSALLHTDVLSLHVPLERSGPYPTWHLLDSEQLGAMRSGAVLVNTSRSEVVVDRLSTQLPLQLALDVWPGEPSVEPGLVATAALATPHIAGYSRAAKQHGGVQVSHALRAWAGARCQHGCRCVVGLTGIAGHRTATRGVARCAGAGGLRSALSRQHAGARAEARCRFRAVARQSSAALNGRRG